MLGISTEGYSQFTGFIFVFNLIVGTGALTLPAVFQRAGWILSVLAILALAFMSYVTLTFVIESMAVANAVLRKRRRLEEEKDDAVQSQASVNSVGTSQPQDLYETEAIPRKKPLSPGSSPRHLPIVETASHNIVNMNEVEPLLASDALSEEHDDSICEIVDTVEMGTMARLFFNRIGTSLFFLCVCIYLYGDLAIYGAAMSRTITDVICTHMTNGSCNATMSDDELCFNHTSLTRFDVYRISLGVFVGLLGPFVFFNVQKTKYLQVMTLLMRWSAFASMIVLAIRRLIHTPTGEKPPTPTMVNWEGLPNLFGVCVYSFMCHHSLPSLVTPISNKKHIFSLLSIDYMLILLFYLLLSLTGIFAFPFVEDLYTLNFIPSRCDIGSSSVADQVFRYFLALFPVFTLSASFPIIAITLRNNLRSLFLQKPDIHYNKGFVTYFFPLLALLPPLMLAFCSHNLQTLIGITGSYAGSGIQYFIPAFLVFSARRILSRKLRLEIVDNKYRSPFGGNFWIIFVIAWATACIGIVTYNHFSSEV